MKHSSNLHKAAYGYEHTPERQDTSDVCYHFIDLLRKLKIYRYLDNYDDGASDYYAERDIANRLCEMYEDKYHE